jgi:hypothetical protein
MQAIELRCVVAKLAPWALMSRKFFAINARRVHGGFRTMETTRVGVKVGSLNEDTPAILIQPNIWGDHGDAMGAYQYKLGGCMEYIRGWDEARRRTEDRARAVVWSTPLDQTTRFWRLLDGTRTLCPISHRRSTLCALEWFSPVIFCRPPLPPTTSAYAWLSALASSGLVVSGRSGQPAGPGKPTLLGFHSRTRSRREDADDSYLIPISAL